MNRIASKGFLVIGMLSISISCVERKEYKISNCSDVWNGDFYDFHEGKKGAEIHREGDIQIEKTEEGSIGKFKVQWLDSCRYRLTYISGNTSMNAKNLKPVIVQISAVNIDSYSIEGWVEGDNFRTYSSKIIRKKKKNRK